MNCSSICRPLTYGELCSQTCNCSNSSCHHVYGCTGMSCRYQSYLFWNQLYFLKQTNINRMKILLSVNWNISECPLNAQGTFTEIRISGTVQWPFSGHSVPLNAAEWQAHFSDHSVIFLIFRVKNSKKNHQIRCFKLILLWITTHEIMKLKKNMPTTRVEPAYLGPCCS